MGEKFCGGAHAGVCGVCGSGDWKRKGTFWLVPKVGKVDVEGVESLRGPAARVIAYDEDGAFLF